MDLEPIRDHIGTLLPRLAVGVDLFAYSMPAQTSRGVVVVAEPAMSSIDYYIQGVYKHRIQVIVRDSDYTRGMKTANEISDLLKGERLTIGNHFFDFIRPRHLPMAYQRGESDQMEFSVNYDTRFTICP